MSTKGPVSPHGVKGGICNHGTGTLWYGCDNYRPESPGGGRVVADLYDLDGNYHRTAVVADCGSTGAVRKYIEEQTDRLDNKDNPWIPFTEDFDYEKDFYQVRDADGQVFSKCWPNAGKMNRTDGVQGNWSPSDNIEVRQDLKNLIGY